MRAACISTVCSLHTVVYRLHASVSGADSIGLQCVIVGVDPGTQSVDALHTTVCMLHTTVKCRLRASLVEPPLYSALDRLKCRKAAI